MSAGGERGTSVEVRGIIVRSLEVFYIYAAPKKVREYLTIAPQLIYWQWKLTNVPRSKEWRSSKKACYTHTL